MISGRCTVGLFVALLGAMPWAQAADSGSAAPDVHVIALGSDAPTQSLRTALRGQAAVVIFWRSDCAPCLDEIRQLTELRRAAHPMQIVTVGLENAEPLQAQLQRLNVEPHSAWYSLEDPAQVLAAFGTVPRLPLTIALDAKGQICARRRGVLTPVLVAEWLADCMRAATSEQTNE